MFFLYADESGSVGNPSETHFVVAGVSMFEKRAYYLTRDLDKIAGRFTRGNPAAIELHGSPMHSGRKGWNKFSRTRRIDAIMDALKLVDGKTVRIFACVVRKSAIPRENPLSYCFELLF